MTSVYLGGYGTLVQIKWQHTLLGLYTQLDLEIAIADGLKYAIYPLGKFQHIRPWF